MRTHLRRGRSWGHSIRSAQQNLRQMACTAAWQQWEADGMGWARAGGLGRGESKLARSQQPAAGSQQPTPEEHALAAGSQQPIPQEHALAAGSRQRAAAPARSLAAALPHLCDGLVAAADVA